MLLYWLIEVESLFLIIWDHNSSSCWGIYKLYKVIVMFVSLIKVIISFWGIQNTLFDFKRLKVVTKIEVLVTDINVLGHNLLSQHCKFAHSLVYAMFQTYFSAIL